MADMQFMQMQPMGKQAGGMSEFGQKMLQAALAQGQRQAQQPQQPQVGQVMPGQPGGPQGPTNIVPPQQGGGMGGFMSMPGMGGIASQAPMGMLQKLIGGFFGPGKAPGGGGAPGGAAMNGGLGPLV